MQILIGKTVINDSTYYVDELCGNIKIYCEHPHKFYSIVFWNNNTNDIHLLCVNILGNRFETIYNYVKPETPNTYSISCYKQMRYINEKEYYDIYSFINHPALKLIRSIIFDIVPKSILKKSTDIKVSKNVYFDISANTTLLFNNKDTPISIKE